MKKCLRVFIGVIFYFVLTPLQVSASNFNVFDVRPYFFSRWCYSIGTCNYNNPPSGKTLATLSKDHDTLAFVTSLQGIINRDNPSLVLLGHSSDEKWFTNLSSENLFPSSLTRNNVTSLSQLIDMYKNNSSIKGSVVWDGQKPFTLNLALTLAGADNLVVVRKNSELFAQITAAFPVVQDLSGRFNTKRDGYQWIINNYINTGKSAPIIVNTQDGWPIYKYLFLNKMFVSQVEVENWNLLFRDLAITKRAVFVDLGVHPLMKDPIEQQAGVDHDTLRSVISAIQQKAAGKIFEGWGWPPSKYLTNLDCNGDGISDENESVACGEWYWIELFSTYGGVQRVGGGEYYAVEPANMSFYQNINVEPDLPVQPPPLSPQQLLQKRYVEGYPKNFSFENGGGGEPWILETTNRAIHTDSTNASHGSKYLQVNITSTDIGKSFYQDAPISLMNGFTYRFSIKLKTSGQILAGRQVVWGEKNGQYFVLCHNQFSRNTTTYQELNCDFKMQEDGFSKARLQIFIDTANKNYSFDEAYFLGPNTLVFEPNPSNLKFLLLYQGDDDLIVSPYIVRTGIYPFTWYGGGNLPTAYSMTTDLAEKLPLIWNYFVKTRRVLSGDLPSGTTFIMPNSGYGYINNTHFSNAHVNDFIKQTALSQRQFQYRTGWDLEGHAGGAPMTSNDKVLRVNKVIAPEGIYYGGVFGSPYAFREGLGMVPMTDLTFAGDSLTSAAQKLNTTTSNMDSVPTRFHALRSVYVSDKFLNDVVDEARRTGGNFEVVNPSTFFYLYRLHHGQSTPHRLTMVSHNIPSKMTPGQQYAVRLRIRNDGFAIWSPETPNDYRVGIGIQKEQDFTPVGLGATPSFPYGRASALPSRVLPGGEVEITATISAPAEIGTYVVQVDGVKEGYEWFESSGNVPWLRKVTVGVTSLTGDLNNDGHVNFSDLVILLSKFDLSGAAGFISSDIVRDGMVNIFDYRSLLVNFGQ